MDFSFSPWLGAFVLLAVSLFVFAKFYRIALIWFVRGRINRSWESKAVLMTILASIPVGALSGVLCIEVALIFANFLLGLELSISIPSYIEFITAWKPALAAGVAILFLARTVPQTIAGSKVYAYNIEEKFRDQVKY